MTQQATASLNILRANDDARCATAIMSRLNLSAGYCSTCPIFPQLWGRKIAKSRLPRLRFHDLRHAHATHLLANGVHPKVASERLGHSKVGITLDLYSHVIPGMQEDAAAMVDAALKLAGQKREQK